MSDCPHGTGLGLHCDKCLAAMVEEWRVKFEDAVFSDYFVRSVKFKPNKQFAECDAMPKAVLLARSSGQSGEGKDYADLHIDAMWHGWKLAKGLVR